MRSRPLNIMEIPRGIREVIQKDGMKMNDKKCCDHIKGVVCDVKNCAYHDGETRCTAGEITVGPTYASTSHDTACATFKPNEDVKG